MTFKRDFRICFPHRFSNDSWRADTAADLRQRLASQVTPPENSAALVIGSGGLPYLLSVLRASRICVVDVSKNVLTATTARVEMLRDHEDWEGYHEGVATRLDTKRDSQRRRYAAERNRAQQSGLQSDFLEAKKQEQAALFTYERGDIRNVAPRLGELAIASGHVFTFLNFTNVAEYMSGGHREMAALLDTLPLAHDAVIVDSSPGLRPCLYTPEEYRNQGRVR